MTKTTDNKSPAMSDERIAELQNFKTKDYSDCPVQTQEQLQEFKPRPPSSPLRLCDSAPWREKNREVLEKTCPRLYTVNNPEVS